MRIKIIWTVYFAISTYSYGQSSIEYLIKVSNNLDKIKSASYFSTKIASAPEDTLKFTEPRKTYRKFFVNPLDSLVGSNTASFSTDDTTKIINFYNGVVSGNVNWDKQYVLIDSFKNQRAPFRLVYYPFYTQINEIIKYTLTTKDKIKTEFKDYGDSVFFSLKIINKHMYFVIKPMQIENEYIPKDEVSQYDIWFNKKDNMPYRMRSKWHHQTVFEYCENVNFNMKEPVTFNVKDYYPTYFEITQFVRSQRKSSNLIGKKAPEWVLNDLNGNQIKLSDLKNKVLLVQFTGVGCGPCHQSIPFIKQLVKDYKTKDFEFVSIETWSNNIDGLKRYQQKNELNFKFLKSNDEVIKSYDVYSVPAFFIIDEKRIIRNVINGYNIKSTNSKIRESIDKFL
jgi:peroxiredoxin